MIARIQGLSISATALLLLAAMFFAAPASVSAQDAPEPKRYENADWNQIVLVNYRPGQTARAMEIIDKHFLPASERAGTSLPLMFEMMGGEWDVMLVWTMKDGPSAMEWEVSPDNVKWRAALGEMEGSAEKAQELYEEYIGLVHNSTSYISISGRRGMKLSAAQ